MRLGSKGATVAAIAAVWVAAMLLLQVAASGSAEEVEDAVPLDLLSTSEPDLVDHQDTRPDGKKQGDQREYQGETRKDRLIMASKGAAMAAAAAAVGVAATPLLVPAVVGMAGFGPGGIAAGSWAAGLMSSYGGTVAAGSVCAVLQSVGTAGLATSTIIATKGVAVSLAGVSGYLFKRASDSGSNQNEVEETAAPNLSSCKCEHDIHASEVEELEKAGAAVADADHSVEEVEEAAPFDLLSTSEKDLIDHRRDREDTRGLDAEKEGDQREEGESREDGLFMRRISKGAAAAAEAAGSWVSGLMSTYGAAPVASSSLFAALLQSVGAGGLGSWAAALMSASGATAASGSICAVLQSVCTAKGCICICFYE